MVVLVRERPETRYSAFSAGAVADATTTRSLVLIYPVVGKTDISIELVFHERIIETKSRDPANHRTFFQAEKLYLSEL
jgi:hypothetical protein